MLGRLASSSILDGDVSTVLLTYGRILCVATFGMHRESWLNGYLYAGELKSWKPVQRLGFKMAIDSLDNTDWIQFIYIIARLSRPVRPVG